MSKETYYFPHDYEPTSDPKVQALLGEFGGLGYGVYWRVIEMLHSDASHKLPLKEYIYLAIAKQMLTSAEQIKAIISFATHQCELFVSDNENVWSKRVNDNFLRREEISGKRSLAGRAGAIAKQNLANASKRKEKKVKEKKEYSDVFLSFYSAYPKKVGKDAAWKAWCGRKDIIPDISILLAAISEQSKSQDWIKDKGQFIPHPATWINAGRWQDEIKTEKSSW